MTKLNSYVLRFSRLSLWKCLVFIIYSLYRFFYKKKLHIQTTLLTSYSASNIETFSDLRKGLLKLPSPEDIHKIFPQCLDLADKFLNHEFNLLGSGWTKVNYKLKAKGREGFQYPLQSRSPKDLKIFNHNQNQSLQISKNISSDYQPIPWHVDFISGFEWPMIFSKNISYGHLPGIDIKVPWELSRMQHLTCLVYAYQLSQNSTKKEKIGQEIQDQILDFIAHNPPYQGVNWYCAMDVAIRACNWLACIDFLLQLNFEFKENFQKTFRSSIEDHYHFIKDNLENSPEFKGNHYLANLAGLIFISTYIKKWTYKLPRFIKELHHEIAQQFFDDGSNFEGSTCYHRLSLELVAYPLMLAQTLYEKDLSESLFTTPPLTNHICEKLMKACQFSIDITYNLHGDVIQVGDNDNGRLLKLHPTFYDHFENKDVFISQQVSKKSYGSIPRHVHNHKNSLNENFNNQFCTRNAIESILIKRPALSLDAIAFSQIKFSFKNSLFSFDPKKISNHQPQMILQSKPKTSLPELNQIKQYLNTLPRQQEYTLPLDGLDPNRLTVTAYPNFGLYIFRLLKSDALFFSIRCGSIGQNGKGGHDHLDQLSIELHWNHQPLIIDPGTFIYTALPKKRNFYRSREAHFAPQIKSTTKSPPLSHGLFYLHQPQSGKVLHLSPQKFLGSLRDFSGNSFYRKVLFQENQVTITDYYDGEQTLIPLKYRGTVFSPYYGTEKNI